MQRLPFFLLLILTCSAHAQTAPNIVFFDELQKAGVQMVSCGQAMFIFNIKREEMIPAVKVAYSARTAMTSYQMKGYVLHTHLDR